MNIITKIRCWLGWHKRLDVIQSFGAAQHIGCHDCGKRYAIHHGERACVPWDADFHAMYTRFGYDVDGELAKWVYHRRRGAK